MADKLEALVDEVVRLRFEESLPEVTATPIEILDSLRRTRQRMDRVEEILFQIMRLKGAKVRDHLVLKAEADEKWDAKIEAVAQRQVRVNGQEWIAPREKYATANLATLNEQRAVRAAELTLKRIEEVEAVVSQARWGLDSLRQDHNNMLKALVVESSLER